MHAALGEPARLAIVDELSSTDRAPMELATLLDIPSNLLAHHLDVLENAGVIVRYGSAGDRRRKYVRLVHEAFDGLPVARRSPRGEMLFVCSHNSARSQLAAAIWNARTGETARSAGTHPASRVHPGAVAAARRAGMSLDGAVPRVLDAVPSGTQVVTVCDRAHEELEPAAHWWHWSIPDPVETGSARAFDAVVADIDARIAALDIDVTTTGGDRR